MTANANTNTDTNTVSTSKVTDVKIQEEEEEGEITEPHQQAEPTLAPQTEQQTPTEQTLTEQTLTEQTPTEQPQTDQTPTKEEGVSVVPELMEQETDDQKKRRAEHEEYQKLLQERQQIFSELQKGDIIYVLEGHYRVVDPRLIYTPGCDASTFNDNEISEGVCEGKS